MSSVSYSLNCVGASCFSLSIWIATSAVLRGGRLLLPAKMTSSISAARIDLCEVSPMTQRSASTRFDLPQPFGPTTPVSPGSIRKSVGSTKDLNPIRRRRVSFISALFQLPPQRFAAPPKLSAASAPVWRNAYRRHRALEGYRIGAENVSAGPRRQHGSPDLSPPQSLGRRKKAVKINGIRPNHDQPHLAGGPGVLPSSSRHRTPGFAPGAAR